MLVSTAELVLSEALKEAPKDAPTEIASTEAPTEASADGSSCEDATTERASSPPDDCEA